MGCRCSGSNLAANLINSRFTILLYGEMRKGTKLSRKKRLQLAAATQSRKMHCNATKGNLIAIPVWRPCFFVFLFFLHDVCIAAQLIEDQGSRLVIPQGDQNPGGSMSGNCEYDRN